MKKFENKKSFKTPKKVWEGKRRGDKELDDMERLRNADAVLHMVDGPEHMEIGADEGEVYIHDIDNDTWLWLTPEEAESVGAILSAWAVELMD